MSWPSCWLSWVQVDRLTDSRDWLWREGLHQRILKEFCDDMSVSTHFEFQLFVVFQKWKIRIGMEVVLCWCFLLFFITCGLTGRGFKTPHSYLYQLKLTIILFLSDEYVICLGCKSPDTILTKENRLFFLRCEKVNFLYPFAFFSFSSSSFTPSFLPT